MTRTADGSPSNAPDAAEPIDTEDTRAFRERLIRRVERYEKLDPKVAQAMLAVPRHVFVPETLRNRAYDDDPLPIGEGQTISQPTVVAMMTTALRLTGSEVVLEIGTGSGYQAAILARLCQRVETIEVVARLAANAEKALALVGCDNVRVHVGDGYEGLPQLAPFDGMIITAAPLDIPLKLLDQLKNGGRLVVPVGPQLGVQDLLLIQKRGESYDRVNLGAVRFVPMVHRTPRN